MTTNPMTPREDVEALCAVLRSGDGEMMHWRLAATMLRALMAERDAAYRRGQEDMRAAAIRAVSATQSEILLAAGELKSQELRTAKAILAWKERKIAKLQIKETPDA